MIRKHAIAARASALLLFALGTLAALARGGLALRAQSLACAGAAVILTLAAFADRRRRTPRLPLLALAPVLVFVFAALQCLPLPAALLELIAPLNATLRFFPPAPRTAFAPLTLDLPATASQLAPAFAVAAAFAAAAILSQRARAQILLLTAPIAAALVQIGISFVRLAGEGHLAGTFVNRNHLAALLVLGALTAMGAALSPPREAEPGMLPPLATMRPLWIASGAACAAFALLTLSRGAAVGLFAGSLALVWMERRAGSVAAGQDRTRRRWRLVFVVIPLAAALGAALLLTQASLTGRFEQLGERPLSADLKLRSFEGAARVALDHPLFGVGRGAWRFVADLHRSVPGEMEFVYVENEPLQLAAEEGLPIALAVLLLLAFGWLRAARASCALEWERANHSGAELSFGDAAGLSRGALAGTLAVALQNLVDFNLSLPGVALPFAIALGAAAFDERALAKARAQSKNSAEEPRSWKKIPRPLLVAMLPLGLALSSLPILLSPWSAERESNRLVFEARDANTSSEALLADAEETVARHPADWLVSLAPAIGLHLRTPRRTAEALAWAGRAQLLGPTSWRPHVVAAAILLRAGRAAQARVETRVAMESIPAELSTEPIELAIKSSNSLDELLEATPGEPLYLARVAAALRVARRPELARALLDHALAEERSKPPAERNPEGETALRLELAELFRASNDFAGVEQQAAQLPRSSCARALLLAEALRAQKRRPEEIEAPLLEARASCEGMIEIPDLLIHGRLARGDTKGASELLDDPALANTRLPFAASVHIWRAELLEAEKDPARALQERWLAALVAPDNASFAIDYADRLRAQGDLNGAISALRALLLRATGDARGPIAKRVSELQKLRAP